MISHLNNSNVRNAYQNNLGEPKDVKKVTTLSAQGDLSKVDQIKESIASGEYKINLQALSEKIADELL